MTNEPFKIEKLDFDALYDEAEKKKNYHECPSCEERHMLCPVCNVCLKYCHNDYFHEQFDDLYEFYDEQALGGESEG